LLFNLDLKGLAVSGGSACSSGSVQKSHVIAAMDPEHTDPVVRFSIGKDNSTQDIEKALAIMAELKQA